MATPARTLLVVVWATPRQAADLFRELPRLATAARLKALLIRVGLQALVEIHKAFLLKAAGGRDGGGVWWKRLSPETIRRSPKRRQPVEILRVRDDLEMSLNPADPDGGHQSVPRRRLQVFRIGGRAVTVGSRRRWAWTHHVGLSGPRMRLPRRRLWPAPHRWPPSWWGRVARQARAGFIDLVIDWLRGRP